MLVVKKYASPENGSHIRFKKLPLVLRHRFSELQRMFTLEEYQGSSRKFDGISVSLTREKSGVIFTPVIKARGFRHNDGNIRAYVMERCLIAMKMMQWAKNDEWNVVDLRDTKNSQDRYILFLVSQQNGLAAVGEFYCDNQDKIKKLADEYFKLFTQNPHLIL